jgi:hypothetical protein
VRVADDDAPIDSPAEPGWYPDPFSATGTGERYFDGEKWGSTLTPLAGHTPKPKKEKGQRSRGRATVDVEERPPPQGARRYIVPLVVLAVLAAGFYALPKLLHRSSSPATVPKSTVPQPQNRPPAGTEEASAPLGTPAPVPKGPGKYEISEHQPNDPNTPVAWDPCRPIHYVVNPAGAPPGAAANLRAAIASVHAATGLRFLNDGTTNETPDKQRLDYQPDRYDPQRWAPVLIAWSDENTFPELAGYVDGVTTTDGEYTPDNQHEVYVSGQIVFDDKDLAGQGATLMHEVMLHELGHLAGLAHTSDATQVMYSESQFNVNKYGAGDRRGLALLGTQACYPTM